MAKENVERDLQEKVALYRSMENRLNLLSSQREMFSNKIVEVHGTLNGIEDMSKEGSDIVFPIGSGSFIKGRLADENSILMEIGSNVVMEMTFEESKKYLEERKKELEDGIENIIKEIQSVAKNMQDIEAAAQKMIMKAQKEESDFRVVSG